MTDIALSLVIPVRGSHAELQEFLRSLVTQSLVEEIECVFVVFGLETDVASVRDALAPHALRAEIVAAIGADISGARRAGAAAARGAWVSFPNARDVLGPAYIASALAAIRRASDRVDALVAPRARLGGPRIPRSRAASATTDVGDDMLELPADVTRMFLRTAVVPPAGAALDSYSDALLLVDLLSARGRPRTVVEIQGSHYLRRPLRGPDPQTAWLRGHAAHYGEVVSASSRRLEGARGGEQWPARLVLRVIRQLVAFEFATSNRSTTLEGDAGVAFRAELSALLNAVGEGIVDGPTPEVYDEVRDILWALRGRSGPPTVAHVIGVDRRSQEMEVRYAQWGASRAERFALEGRPLDVRNGKHRLLEAFGAPVMHQRIAWVPATSRVSLELDGGPVAIRFRDGAVLDPDADARRIAQGYADRTAARQRAAAPGRRDGGLRVRAYEAVRRARRSWLSRAAGVRMLSRVPLVATEFTGAWTLMDRADMGGDNAEHMYRWLMVNHPEVNAWFVLRSDSPDFARLDGEGFRLVEYGSVRHQMLLNRTRHYLSSHVGVDVNRPIFDRYLLREAPWVFTFLQHGVIHNDLSLWLNRQRMRLFLTSTHGEFDGISGDESPYVFTDREVRLTGLPRFDRLRAIADAAPPDQRRTIVVAPTWRNGLFEPAERTGHIRRPKPGFLQSTFVQSLLGVLNHPRLAELAAEGYAVRFVPHPNLAAHFPYDLLPPFVTVSTYDSADVQELIGTARVFLTDYSSVAFDAAFADAHVVYMQLDEGAIYGVDHTLFPGYFDFERNGFGPVCDTVDRALDAVSAAAHGEASPVFRQRARDAFAHWDSGACQRVFDAVSAIDSSDGPRR